MRERLNIDERGRLLQHQRPKDAVSCYDGCGEVERVVAAQRRLRKEAQRQAMLQERRAAARAHAEELARKIASADPTVRRIWGFGSTFDVRLRFREYSDIDLAVEGGEIIAWQISQRSRRQGFRYRNGDHGTGNLLTACALRFPEYDPG